MGYPRRMFVLTETIAFVFGLIALGYVAAWTGHLKPQVGDALTQFVVGVALPVLLFKVMIEADSSIAAPWRLWIVYLSAAAIIWTISQFAAARIFDREPKVAVVGGVAGSFSNLVLLGLPLVGSAFGAEGTLILSLVIAVHLPAMMAASVIQMEWVKRGEGEGSSAGALLSSFLRNLLGNPLVLGIAAGLVWRFGGFAPPTGLLGRFVTTFAGLAGPLALFAMGASLRGMDVKGDVLAALGLSFVKLVLMPLLVVGLTLLAGLPPLAAKIAIVGAAMPTGVNAYLIASRFGVGQALASNTMTIGTAAAFVTSTFWLIVATAIYG